MDLLVVLASAVLADMFRPLVLLPAMAIGWLARSAWLVAAGAGVTAVVQIAASLSAPLPADAQRVLWAEPLHMIAPAAIAFTAFRLRNWLRSRDAAAPGSLGPRLVRTMIGAGLGGAAGTALMLGLGLAVITLAGIHDREGGEGYLVVLVFAPIGLVVGLTIGAVVGWRRAGRAKRDTRELTEASLGNVGLYAGTVADAGETAHGTVPRST